MLEDTKQIPLVAIVGRTNVGKSSLFNAIVGRRAAIVEDEAGVTRDRNYALVKRFARPFTLVDTGGLVGEEDNPFKDSVRLQSEAAISEADLILVVLDARHGVHPLDPQVVNEVKRAAKPVIWIANKCEKEATKLQSAELYALGIDDLVLVSAAHKLGIRELAQKITAELERLEDITEKQEEVQTEEIEVTESKLRPLKIAVLGRPNVGKSTLLNKIIGEDRLLTSPQAGTTRDSIKIEMRRNGRDMIMLDTAGLRKKARVDDLTVERYSNLRALRALAECDVAVLVLDASQGLPSEQDAKIAGLINERGRGFVIAVNKWDLVEKDHRSVKNFERGIRDVLKFSSYAPIVFISALSGRRCPAVLDRALQLYDAGAERIKTADLNRILGRAIERKPPPAYHSDPVKLFFSTQVSVRPPEIVLFFNHPAKINGSYQRYLKNSLREHYSCEGYDIKFQLRKRTEKAARMREAAGS